MKSIKLIIAIFCLLTLSFAAAGATLTVDYFIDRGEQSFESKRVFVKK